MIKSLFKLNLIFILIFSSCHNNENIIYYNNSIEMSLKNAHELNKKLCVLIIDNIKISEEYLESLQDEDLHAIFNVIDINEVQNKWYQKWLCPYDYPVACIFHNNDLISIISGFSYESIYEVKSTLKNPRKQRKIFFPNRFGMEEQDIVTLMDEVLKCKLNLDRNKNITKRIEKVINILDYPFSAYLKIKNEENLNRYVEELCKEFRKFRNFYNLLVYKEEFQYIEKLISHDYDNVSMPKLTIVSNSFNMDNCKLGEEYHFDIMIKNTGKSSLSLLRVMTSCSCLRFDGYSNFTLYPNEEITLPFIFKPDSKGDIYREISILSDDPENPLSNMIIKTHVH